jgi:glyoxylate/hydroxypyruvate reductase A
MRANIAAADPPHSRWEHRARVTLAPMTVLLATNFDDAEMAQWALLLREAMPDETLAIDRTRVDDEAIDVAIVANPPPGALAGLPRLRLVQSLWAGVDKLLADPTIPVEVPLARMVDPVMNEAMAQTALWAVLHLHRDFIDYERQQREGVWRQRPQRRADEVPVAVLGMGQMGGTVARRLSDNGYPVSGWGSRSGEGALADVLRVAEIVINLLPLTPATQGFFDARRFAQMRPGASLVNLARGGHVVEADLLAALERGHLRHAVLDVFDSEPLPAGHPFWSHASVTVLPHVAALTDPRSAAAVAAANIRTLRAGGTPRHLVERERGY